MKKLFMGLIILILLAGITIFLLDSFDIYKIETLKQEAVKQVSQIPVVGEFIGLQKENQELKTELEEIKKANYSSTYSNDKTAYFKIIENFLNK